MASDSRYWRSAMHPVGVCVRRFAVGPLVCLVAVLALAACSSSDGGSTDDNCGNGATCTNVALSAALEGFAAVTDTDSGGSGAVSTHVSCAGGDNAIAVSGTITPGAAGTYGYALTLVFTACRNAPGAGT